MLKCSLVNEQVHRECFPKSVQKAAELFLQAYQKTIAVRIQRGKHVLDLCIRQVEHFRSLFGFASALLQHMCTQRLHNSGRVGSSALLLREFNTQHLSKTFGVASRLPAAAAAGARLRFLLLAVGASSSLSSSLLGCCSASSSPSSSSSAPASASDSVAEPGSDASPCPASRQDSNPFAEKEVGAETGVTAKASTPLVLAVCSKPRKL